MAFLFGLDDESKWSVRRNVPVFVPHTRKNKDGPDTVVTADDLAEYAANTAALEREFGVCGRITEGHVVPGRAERDQPDLVGVFRNARLGTFGPKNTPAVLVDEYIRKDKESVALNRPYRSPEVYHGRKDIRGLARLISDPFLDMGIVTTYAADLQAAWTAAPEKTMSQTAAPQGEELATLYTKLAAVEAENKANAEALKLEREARLNGEKLLDKERCVAMVNTLVATGYSLTAEEREEEAKELQPRDAAGRAKYVEKLKKTYADRKVPGGPLVDLSSPQSQYHADHTQDPTAAPPAHDAVMAYMRQHPGMGYDAASAEVAAKK